MVLAGVFVIACIELLHLLLFLSILRRELFDKLDLNLCSQLIDLVEVKALFTETATSTGEGSQLEDPLRKDEQANAWMRVVSKEAPGAGSCKAPERHRIGIWALEVFVNVLHEKDQERYDQSWSK